MRPHLLQLRRPPGGLAKRCDGRLILLEGIDLGACSEREGKGADAGEQICHALGGSHAFLDQPDQRRLRLTRGLQEGPWRQPNPGAGKRHGGLAGKNDAIAVHRDAGSSEGPTCRCEFGEQ